MDGEACNMLAPKNGVSIAHDEPWFAYNASKKPKQDEKLAKNPEVTEILLSMKRGYQLSSTNPTGKKSRCSRTARNWLWSILGC